MDKRYRTDYNIEQHGRGTSHEQTKPYSKDNVPTEKKQQCHTDGYTI